MSRKPAVLRRLEEEKTDTMSEDEKNIIRTPRGQYLYDLRKLKQAGTGEGRNPFLTGSRVYGTPHEDSDYDLVILVDRFAADILWRASESDKKVCFGKLNLIVCTEPKQFDIWKRGTAELTARKPVARDEAVAHFKSLRVAAGLSG